MRNRVKQLRRVGFVILFFCSPWNQCIGAVEAARKTPLWPPPANLRDSLPKNSPEISATIESQKLILNEKDAPGRGVILSTVLYYHHDEFLGITQRFEEAGPGNKTDTCQLPERPATADKAVIVITECDVAVATRELPWFGHWYSNSWGHFTTVSFVNGHYDFRTWNRATDMDLLGWLLADGIKPTSVRTFSGEVSLKPEEPEKKK